MELTRQRVQADLDALPEHYKTGDVDRLIRQYVQQGGDTSPLRHYILREQQFHRIYFYVPLKQMRDVNQRMEFIHRNLLFSDWWHTDQLINFVSKLDFKVAMDYALGYINGEDPFIRRWGYVMFISRLGRGHAAELLPLIHDDGEYYVQMAQAWLIAELAICQPEEVYNWMKRNGLKYEVNGKAIQKICDSFRITDEWKEKMKGLRPMLRQLP